MGVLGIDFGEKKVGLAVANRSIALPLKVIKGNQSFLVEEIVDICRREDIEKVILGLPLGREGIGNPMTAKVREFGKRLAKKLNIEVKLWDEKLSSREAQERLIEAGFLGQKRKAREDSMAAAIILQSYLDYQSQERR